MGNMEFINWLNDTFNSIDQHSLLTVPNSFTYHDQILHFSLLLLHSSTVYGYKHLILHGVDCGKRN